LQTKRRKIMPKITITGAKGLVQSTGLGLVHGSPKAVATADEAEAAAATTLTADTLTVVTRRGGGNVNDRLYLPDPSALDIGTTVTIASALAFELSSAGASTKINGVAVSDGSGDYAAEVALGIGHTTCVVVAADEWVVGPVAAAPDA
jgi:hypothetical protein